MATTILCDPVTRFYLLLVASLFMAMWRTISPAVIRFARPYFVSVVAAVSVAVNVVANVVLEAPIGEMNVDDADAADAGDEEFTHDTDAIEAQQERGGLRFKVQLIVKEEGKAADDGDAFVVAFALRAFAVVTQLTGQHGGRVGGQLVVALEFHFLAEDEIGELLEAIAQVVGGHPQLMRPVFVLHVDGHHVQ